MQPTLSLTFPTQPALAATMDIQIPALAWQPAADGRWQRTYWINGQPTLVQVSENVRRLDFAFDATPAITRKIVAVLRGTFPVTVAGLELDGHPVLKAMRQRYQGVVVMATTPFEALVLTILSQNRTGEIVRQVYPRLAAASHGAAPAKIAELAEPELAEVIRSAGPYKAPRLLESAAHVAALGEATFDQIVRGPTQKALAFLESLPGVAHKTAACVLVFAAATTSTLPVDTHLFRVVDRLGLASHDGRLNQSVRAHLIASLLSYGPALAPAHFLFLLIGRSTCTASTPACHACFLAPHCRHATENQEPTP